MPVLSSAVDVSSEQFAQNRADQLAAVAALDEQLDRTLAGRRGQAIGVVGPTWRASQRVSPVGGLCACSSGHAFRTTSPLEVAARAAPVLKTVAARRRIRVAKKRFFRI